MTFPEIELYENAKRFLLIPRVIDKKVDDVTPTKSDFDNVVLADRQTCAFSKIIVPKDQRKALFASMKTMTRIFGIVGVIKLLSGSFLIVILEREFMYNIRGHEVFKLKKIQFIPFTPSTFRNQDEGVKEREIAYIEMMNKVLVEEDSFYFSYTCNLTVNFQDQLINKSNSSNRHFFWNRHLSARLITSNLPKFVLPMIRGYIEVADCTIHDKTFKFGIISRTSCRRAGTRYNCRGADLKGNVANFVETEHFIIYDGVFSSFAQVRGSIPLVWTQYANLKYTPEIKFLTDKQKQKQAFEMHFADLANSYPGPFTCLNLCKKKGQEKRLSDVYETFWKNTRFTQDVKYIHFDFHHECKNLNFVKLVELMQDLGTDFRAFKYFVERYDVSQDPDTWNVSTPMITRSISSTTLSAQTGRVAPTSDTLSVGEPQHLPKSKSLIDFQNTIKDPQLEDIPYNPRNTEEIDDAMKMFETEEKKSMQQIAKEFNITDIDDRIRMKNIDTDESLKLPNQGDRAVSPASPRPDENEPLYEANGFERICLQQQRGAFRVNCIDCCDRTNVVETYLSRQVLLDQLFSIGILPKRGESFLAYPRFESIFNHFWASNGDKVSVLYAGTQALMGDYTRTGQRSVQGLLNDGMNSAKRYLKNNFTDQQRQRAIYLVLGLLDLQSEAEIQAFQGKDIVSELFLL